MPRLMDLQGVDTQRLELPIEVARAKAQLKKHKQRLQARNDRQKRESSTAQPSESDAQQLAARLFPGGL